MRLDLIAAVSVLLLSLAFASPTLAQDCNHPRVISVSGNAEIKLAPDEAVLRLGVESRDKELASAKADNDQRVKKLISLTHAAGVDPKYVQTSALRMGPEYSQDGRKNLLGYEVSQSVNIILKDLSKYEALMTGLLEAGVNRVDSIEFRVAEPRKYKDEARRKAIRAAREKAVALAAELGQTVGKPWEILEDVDPWGSAGKLNVASETVAVSEEESTVAPGEVAIRASLRATFLLE